MPSSKFHEIIACNEALTLMKTAISFSFIRNLVLHLFSSVHRFYLLKVSSQAHIAKKIAHNVYSVLKFSECYKVFICQFLSQNIKSST